MESLRIYWISVVLIIFGGHSPVFSNPTSKTVNCIYNNKTNPYFHREEVPKQDLFTDSQGRLVVSGCSACFTLWNTEEDGSLLILGQGCWSSLEDCHASSCNDYALDDAPTKSKLCCCTADSCNGVIVTSDPSFNHTLIPAQEPLTPLDMSGYSIHSPTLFLTLLSIVSLLLLLVCLLVRVFCLLRKRSKSKSTSPFEALVRNNISASTLLESSKLLPATPPLSDLSRKILDDELDVHFDLGTSLEGGLFGSVAYTGLERASRQKVLIKVPSSAEAYLNEARIYEALSPHPSILKLLYHSQNYICRGVQLDHILVFNDDSPQMPLSSFLKENTISWRRLVSFLISITDGVAHIHSDSQGHHPNRRVSRGSVCHRNLSSDNIFVRGDFSVCIGDFSRAVRVSGGQVLQGEGGEEEVPASSLSFHSGDPRYMAPEFLEGTLNFRDAESAFKQGDVYSLGLLFWEVSRRCEDLYQGSGVPEFEYPFQRETQGRPASLSVESMKVLVSRYRSRPLFPSVWKDSNPAVQLLRETIEDSWDQDGEARLTAFCVRERLSELLPLWERYKKNKNYDLSPVNNSNNLLFNNSSNIQANSSRGGASGVFGPEAASSSQLVIKNNDAVFHANDFSRIPQIERENEVRSSKNDNVLSNQQPSLRLQPYQGRNPCKERNLNISATSSTFDKGDGLILNSSKDFFKASEERGESRRSLGEDPNLLPNYSPATPIPYLRNDLSRCDNNKLEGEESLRPPGEEGEAPFYSINLISKEKNRERRSHSGLHRGLLSKRSGNSKRKKNEGGSSVTTSAHGQVIIVESKDKQCNLDTVRTLLNENHVVQEVPREEDSSHIHTLE